MRIGTRGSELALTQSRYVRSLLGGTDETIPLEIITTSGDRFIDASLSRIGGKGVFTKELEDALLEGRVDLAVHSLKDLPTENPPGLVVAALLTREDPRDALVTRSGLGLSALPSGSRVGTSSLRRRSQLLARRPDLVVEELRGNVPTRLRRVEEGRYDAVVIAAAGLRRLGLAGRITELIDEEIMLPAPGQGVLGIQTRADDEATIAAVRRHHDLVAAAEATAERAFLAGLGGGCLVPVGARGRVTGERLRLEGVVGHPSGRPSVRRSADGPVAAAAEIGRALAETLLASGAREILAEVRSDEVFP
ncbi:MAG TPA: hydroxymethylbilane synthase [Candidatus Eisenbacteria bacterium]|nr:hydroxymethylbilane synthase [Candidatus Eisenbacteria bacterium]